MRITVGLTASMTLLMCLTAANARADDPAAAAAAATDDAQAVLAAFRAYNDAMMRLDEQGMSGHNHVVTERDRRFSDAMVSVDLAIARLKLAAQERFGDDSASLVGKAAGDLSNDDLATATPVIEGDRATILSVAMIKVDGAWKFDLGINDAPDEQVNAAIASLNTRASRAKALLEDLNAGKFKTLQDLLAAIRQREI